MSKRIILLFIIGTCLFISGCNELSLQNASNHLQDISLNKYMESLELPNNLFIAFDSSTVKERTLAKSYNAVRLKLNQEKTIEQLLRFEIQSSGTYAQGPWFKAGNEEWTEYINIHDGILLGGLSYSLVNNNVKKSLPSKLSMVIDPYPGFPDSVSQIYGYTSKTIYDTKKDLSFLSYEEAVSETETILTQLGFPTLTMQEIYSLDVETMRKQYQLYLNTFKSSDELEWSLEDECYLIHFRQTMDGIPLINTLWEERTRSGWDVTETPIYAIYSRDGIVRIYANNLYEIGEAIEEKALINTTSALQILLDDYAKAIQLTETMIVSMELNYVGVTFREEIILIPAWVFGVAHSEMFEDVDNSVNVYKYFIINAFTGERIRTVVDNN